jgi:hypothetical protein
MRVLAFLLPHPVQPLLLKTNRSNGLNRARHHDPSAGKQRPHYLARHAKDRFRSLRNDVRADKKAVRSPQIGQEKPEGKLASLA